MQVDTTKRFAARCTVGKWVPLLLVTIIFPLDWTQTDDTYEALLEGVLLLVAVHAALFAASRLVTIQKRREFGRRISYGVVSVGAAWVVFGFLHIGGVQLSNSFLNAFVLGGLSGTLHFSEGMCGTRILGAAQTGEKET